MLTRIEHWLESEPASRFQAQVQALRRFWTSALAQNRFRWGSYLLLGFLFISHFAPELSPYSPFQLDLGHRLAEPNAQHWLGTDELGRDVLSRLLYGSQISLRIVIFVSLISAPLGLFVGLTAGVFKGTLEKLLSQCIDISLSLPRLIIAMALCTAFGPSIHNAILAIGLTAWAPYARLMYTQARLIRHQNFIKSAQLLGASRFRLIYKYYLPICLPTLLVRLNLDLASFILTAAGLGFLGLGAQPPSPEWGAMLSSSRNFLLSHWWLSAAPGLCILITSLGFNLLGESLRDLIDPKQSQAL